MIQEGTNVKWEWGERYAIGMVKKMYTYEVTKSVYGHQVTIMGKENDKALLIGHTDGTEILMLESEVAIYDHDRH